MFEKDDKNKPQKPNITPQATNNVSTLPGADERDPKGRTKQDGTPAKKRGPKPGSKNQKKTTADTRVDAPEDLTNIDAGVESARKVLNDRIAESNKRKGTHLRLVPPPTAEVKLNNGWGEGAIKSTITDTMEDIQLAANAKRGPNVKAIDIAAYCINHATRYIPEEAMSWQAALGFGALALIVSASPIVASRNQLTADEAKELRETINKKREERENKGSKK